MKKGRRESGRIRIKYFDRIFVAIRSLCISAHQNHFNVTELIYSEHEPIVIDINNRSFCVWRKINTQNVKENRERGREGGREKEGSECNSLRQNDERRL
jgi:hypothetical protein